MAGESQQEPATGQADPTVLTTEALARGLSAERDYQDARREVIVERLAGIDRATELLSATVNRVPTDVQKEISHLNGLMTEKFSSVDQQLELVERQRVEQKQDTKAAVDAALTAQKEAVKEQTTASERAIAKSEASTTKQQEQQATTFGTAISGVASQIDDIKDRLGTIESRLVSIEATKIGGLEQRSQAQAGWGVFVAVGGLMLALIATAVTVIVATR